MEDAAVFVKTKPNSNSVQLELRLDTKLTANLPNTTPPPQTFEPLLEKIGSFETNKNKLGLSCA